jgi:hypothetical protein
MIELCDGLLAHRHPGASGRGGLPGSIEFSTDAEAPASRGWLPWPMFWSAWEWTHEKRYLDPIFDGGVAGFAAVNANALDILDARKDWGTRVLGGEPTGPTTPTETRPGNDTRSRERTATYRVSGSPHFQWQLTGDKKLLEDLYASQIEQCALLEYINTEGSLWIDRVGVPYADLQRARLGGVALLRNAQIPGHVVSWRFSAPANDQSVAILIPDATPTSFKVIAYNLETRPVTATMTGWNIHPGVWEISEGIDADGDDKADSPTPTTNTIEFERTRSMQLSFAPRTTTIVTMKLKTPGTPYWSRPDLGIDRGDVALRDGSLHVTVHSLGSVAAKATTLAVKKTDGSIVASAAIPALEAPLDLHPRTVEVTVALPDGTISGGGIVEIDPDHALEEITAINNSAWFAAP